MKNQSSEKAAAMSMGKAIGWLMLLYLLIGFPAFWRVREICLLQRDQCGYHDFVETVLSERLVLIASIGILALLIFLTLHVFLRARDGTLGIEPDPPARHLNISGLLVALVVSAIYTSGSLVVLASAASQLEPFSLEKADSYFLKSIGSLLGAKLLFVVLWHLNDFFTKPASKIVLIVLFFVTLGPVFLIGWSVY